MSTDSTIVAAKQEYTQQLYNLLTPLIYSGFQSIWIKCKLEKKSLLQFQLKLKNIPIWNQTIIDNEYKRIVNKGNCEDWLDKLIEAVFSASIKILSTIKAGKIKNVVNVTIPETKTFIHKCYIETARKLWYDPYMIDDREDDLNYSDIKRNHKRCLLAINDSIDKTISDCIPFQALLESYLNELMIEDENDHEATNLIDSDILSVSDESVNIDGELDYKGPIERLDSKGPFETEDNQNDPFMMDPESNDIVDLSEPADLEVVSGDAPDNIVDNNVDIDSIKSIPIQNKGITIPLDTRDTYSRLEASTPEQVSSDEPFFSDSDSESEK